MGDVLAEVAVAEVTGVVGVGAVADGPHANTANITNAPVTDHAFGIVASDYLNTSRGRCSRVGSIRRDDDDRREVKHARGEDEEMPHVMEAEATRTRVRPLQRVDQRTERVDDTAGDEQRERRSR